MAETIILYLFLLSAFIQVLYYLYFFLPLAFKDEEDVDEQDLLPVSVIICAKNEAANLEKNLPVILDQDYPDFEVIVVNDHSQDHTAQILSGFRQMCSHLKVVETNDEFTGKGKKAALATGISKAKNPLLVMTDADCKPASDQWVKLMASGIRGDKQIVLGYGPYTKEAGWLNKFIRFETVHTALLYFGFAKRGMPYMGVGRNLAYLKKLFVENNGFQGIGEKVSGDDDLFIQKAATKKNTETQMHSGSWVYSEPEKKINFYIKQKKRHFSASPSYKTHFQILLMLINVSYLLFYLNLFLLILLNVKIVLIVIVFLCKLFLQLLILNGVFKKLKEKDLVKFLPILEMTYIVYLLIFTNKVIFNQKIEWK